MKLNILEALRIIFMILCFSVLINCNSTENLDSVDILIDLENIPKVKPSTIFPEVEFVPLETSEKSHIRRINQILIHDTYFFILDKSQNSIFTFDDNGDFRYEINNQGEGPGKYSSIEYFAIYNNNLEILDPRGKLFIYDLEGNYKSSVNLDFISVHRFFHLDDNLIVFYSFVDDPLLKFYSLAEGRLLSEHLPNTAHRVRLMGYIMNPFFMKNQKNYFINGTTGNIYQLNENSIKKTNNIDFGINQFDLTNYPKEQSESPKYYLDFLLENNIVHPILYFFPNEDIVVAYYEGEFQVFNLHKDNGGSINSSKVDLPYNVKTFMPFIYSDNSTGIYGYTTDIDSALIFLSDFQIGPRPDLPRNESANEQNPIIIRFSK
ncbi:6-bladed beta-propeller [Portibacter lacus]|uniref:6-bladed beta-propeller n=1 Tax=Portibacter lacus TaxID=1099794 RepID=A0AA37SS82_9BACT|nr:6-bladed beta-propeller [Portibacter lacus]GLR17871.1 hypothetical protein GCM10007940_24860 [Portibacter lacus]